MIKIKVKELTRPEIHKKLITILKEVIEICEDNELVYYAFAGTLLGAVREGDIIPWDVDIDLMMPRDDYNKLIHIYNNESNYTELLHYTNYKTNLPFVKIHNKLEGTKNVIDTKYINPIAVEIHPLDYCPWQGRDHYFLAMQLREYRKICMLKTEFGKYDFRYWMKHMRYFLNGVRYSVKELLELQNDLAESAGGYFTNNGEYSSVNMAIGCWMETKDRTEAFSLNSKYLKFNKLNIKVPGNYDKILSRTYFNYMSPPSDEVKDWKSQERIIQYELI